MKRFREVELPDPDIEYWVVVDDDLSMPHYFLSERDAKAFAQEYGHEIIFKECFD